MGDRQQFSEGGSLFLFPPKELYILEDRQHLGGLPFCPNVQYSLLAKTICFCPFCFLYQEKLVKLSHMWNHSLTLRLFLLPSRLLCSLVRGGTCPLGPYRLIAYGHHIFHSKPEKFKRLGLDWALVGQFDVMSI